MRTIFLSSALAVLIGGWIAGAPAEAQVPPQVQVPPTCPPGYYLAADGYCYPGAPPVYAAPDYDLAPGIVLPPVVIDGFIPGVGYGRHDWGRGGAPRGAPGGHPGPHR